MNDAAAQVVDASALMSQLARQRAVARCGEFVRILNLPRRPQEAGNLDELIANMTRVYRTPIGSMTFRWRQAMALKELHDYGGLFAPLPPGDGKTLVSLMAGRVVESQRTVLLVPAPLVLKTTDQDMPEYSRHFRLAPNIHVVSYSKLSVAGGEALLFDLDPDLVVCDEVQALRDPGSARTRRFLRFFRDRKHVKLAAMSASITSKSLRDYAHILAITHGKDRMPLPSSWPVLEMWAGAIDSDVDEYKRIHPGALMDFCEPNENARQGYRKRLVETPGVVAARTSAFGDGPAPELRIYDVPVERVPEAVTEAFRKLRREWHTPGGEEISDAKSLWRHCGALAFGYYQKWLWPNDQPDHEWLNRRKTWHKNVRMAITHGSRNGIIYDSELMVRRACESELAEGGPNGIDVMEAWRQWTTVAERYGPDGPPKQVVWYSEEMVALVVAQCAYLMQNAKTIVWVRNPELGRKLASGLGVVYFGAGDEGIEQHRQSCVASIEAHGTGRNLQSFHRAIFVARPFNGAHWEQVLCRMWRPGQLYPVVDAFVYNHCRELWEVLERSRGDAAYIEDTISTPQALLRAQFFIQLNATRVSNLAASGDPLWAKSVLKMPKGG